MYTKRSVAILIGACMFLGFILARQFFLQKAVNIVTESDKQSELAIEVSRLIESNKELAEEKAKLNEQYSLIQKSTEDQKTNMDAMASAIEQYKIILGEVKASGSGVSIVFEETMDTTQLTDLMNALRNIGAEAMAINSKRITPTTGWDMKTFSAPYKIQAIGDSNVLKQSLERRGGIMENIGISGQVTIEKKLTLPAAK